MPVIGASFVDATRYGRPPRQFVAYYRVSSRNQGATGLSLEGQRIAARSYIAERGGILAAEYAEVRSGLRSAGRQLREAIGECRMRRAVLVVSAIDRLSRRMALTTALMDSDIELGVVDSPDASRVLLHVKAAWAEYESTLLSGRIKAALAEARNRGIRLGHQKTMQHMRAMAELGKTEWQRRTKERTSSVAPLIWDLRASGKSLSEIATDLNWRNVPTPQGRRWHISQVWRVLDRTKQEFVDQAKASPSLPDLREANARRRCELLAPMVNEIRMKGLTLPEVAEELNRCNIPTARGRRWGRETVRNVLLRGKGALEPTFGLGSLEFVARKRFRSKAWARAAAPITRELRAAGFSFRAIASELQRRNFALPKGGRWRHENVKMALETPDAASPNDLGCKRP